MKTLKSISVLLATLLATSFASANDDGGLFVEPGITYETSSSSIDLPGPFGSTDGEIMGFGLAARLGFHINEAFFVGLDARYSMPKFDDTTTGINENAKAYNWGPVVGMQMPDVGLRVWGSYIAGGEMDPEGSSAFDGRFKDGTGFRVGAGFRVQAISLNLEYQEMNYGSANLDNALGFAPGTNFDSVELENKTWLASVSFPIQL
jgi:Outer membrane protein beta-barrel domain